MNSFYAYSFLAGVFVGGYTNFFSKIIISGLVLYIVNPENFSIEKFNPLYKTIYQRAYPYVSKIYTLKKLDYFIEQGKFEIEQGKFELVQPKVEIMKSPLPKLVIKK